MFFSCMYHLSVVPRGQKRELDALKQELEWFRVALWVLGIEPRSTAKEASALNC